jgi:hypothetical protein
VPPHIDMHIDQQILTTWGFPKKEEELQGEIESSNSPTWSKAKALQTRLEAPAVKVGGDSMG